MFGQYVIDPWFHLFVKQRIAEKKHKHECLNTYKKVVDGIVEKRKKYLGSDLGLTMFVHKNGKPVDKAVEDLSNYLGKLTARFLKQEYNTWDMEELCFGFFHHSLQLYANNKIGDDSFDDLIKLAELFENDTDVLTIVFEMDLSEHDVDEWLEFLSANDYVPRHFTKAVIGAIATLLGVMQ